MREKSELVHKKHFDLLRISLLKKIVRLRSFQFIVIFPNFVIFFILLIASFLGSPIGNHNLGILIVWIVWWAALMLILTPLGGRIWCMICPIPALGEWLQRKTFTAKKDKLLTLKKPWPKKLDNIWLQNLSFLTVSTFIGVLTTRPWATGIMLLLLVIIIPVIVSLIFERRIFCRYICPVSGFIGLYSMIAPLELRVKSRETCLKHIGKECYRGSPKGYGCPWYEFPQNLNRNAYCGLCMECVKTCPLDNISLNIKLSRLGGEDLYVEPWHGLKKRGLDEPFKAFIMSTLAILYALIFAGPISWLKDIANIFDGETFGATFAGNLLIEQLKPENLAIFATIVWGSTLIVMPSLFAIFVAISKALAGWKNTPSFKKMFISYSYMLVPLSLTAWMAFAIYILLINGSYVISTISDPLNLGWNIFGTKDYPWTPFATNILPYIQTTLILLGLVWSIYVIKEISKRMLATRKIALKASIPIIIFALLYTIIILEIWLGSGTLGLGGVF